jgi:phosphoribosylformylglycinamidine synthase subunit PurS
MKKFEASVTVMPKKEILDPQGKAVSASMKNLGLTTVENVRIGKHITFAVEAADAGAAQGIATEACKKLLANLIMEDFHVDIKAL